MKQKIMKQKKFLKIAFFFLIAICTNNSYGQVTLVSNGFEGGDSWTISSGTPTMSSDTGASDTPENSRIKSGSRSWLINNETQSAEFTSQDITGKTGVKIMIHLSSTADTIRNGADSADYIKVWANVNGTGFPANADIQIDGNTNARWDFDATLTATTAAGTNISNAAPQGGTNTNNYATLTITIPDGSTSVALKVEGKNNHINEFWNIDDITLITNASGPLVGFDTATSSVTETNADLVTTGIPISLINYDADIEVTATVNGSSTAEAGDYTIDLSALTFTANGTLNIPLTIKDDADTDDETIIIDITVTSGTAILSTSQHTITITDDEAPVFIVEDFTNSMATASYADDNFLGNNGITWTYVESRNEFGDANGAGIDGNALMFRRSSGDSKVTSSTISGGIGDFSVKLYKGFTGVGDRQVELFINGVSKGSSIAFDDADDKDAYTFTVDDINIGGDIVLEIRNSTDNQVIVDDISWTAFAPTVTWTGIVDSDWANATNWDTSSVPTASDNVLIPDVAFAPIIRASTAAATYDLTITEPDGVLIDSGGSLIVKGTSTGNVTYHRTIDFVAGNLKGWYLMASPVIGQDYDDTYIKANNIAINGTNVGIATYTTSSDSWAYHQDGASATFTSGKGYSVKRASTDEVSFSGTINTDNLVVDAVLTTAGKRFNLLGNPYTSYINSATFLNDESAISETKTMWVFNQTLGTNGSYEVKTVGDAFVVAPGQGFFVKANVAGGTFNFSKANQNHNADTFQKESKTEIKLSITDGTIHQYAKVYYLENATTGFDVGYEGEVFGGKKENFSIYSELVSYNQSKKYQVQSLPNTGLEAMIVPFGLKAAAGKEITFSIEAQNLPNGINVYLEDRLLNTFTRLNEPNTNYKIILADATNGIGRFYVHTASKALSTATKILNSVSIYKTSNINLRIAGLQNGGASVKIFSLLGKQVVSTSFVANGVKEIPLPNLATGIYIVQLQNEAGKLSKKIILE